MNINDCIKCNSDNLKIKVLVKGKPRYIESRIQCVDCKSYGPIDYSVEGAIKLWNEENKGV